MTRSGLSSPLNASIKTLCPRSELGESASSSPENDCRRSVRFRSLLLLLPAALEPGSSISNCRSGDSHARKPAISYGEPMCAGVNQAMVRIDSNSARLMKLNNRLTFSHLYCHVVMRDRVTEEFWRGAAIQHPLLLLQHSQIQFGSVQVRAVILVHEECRPIHGPNLPSPERILDQMPFRERDLLLCSDAF